MKMLIMSIVALAAMTASAKTVTVTVCGNGEAADQCQTVTYKVRAHKDVAAPVEVCTQEGTPCVPTAYGVPAWLKNAFSGHGAGDQNTGSKGGPN